MTAVAPVERRKLRHKVEVSLVCGLRGHDVPDETEVVPLSSTDRVLTFVLADCTVS